MGTHRNMKIYEWLHRLVKLNNNIQIQTGNLKATFKWDVEMGTENETYIGHAKKFLNIWKLMKDYTGWWN